MLFLSAALLDDLDKELNNYIMRCREWYGWHFPELGGIIQDHSAYVKTVKKLGNVQSWCNDSASNDQNVSVGMRTATITMDLSDVLPADLEQRVKDAAQISMGTEISEQDVEHISSLCDQVSLNGTSFSIRISFGL